VMHASRTSLASAPARMENSAGADLVITECGRHD
jgi:hypothetical protein